MTLAQSYIVDTNVLLRFFAKDHAEHGPAAEELVRRSSTGEVILEIPFSVVTATVFALLRIYRKPKHVVSTNLLTLFTCPGIKLVGPSWALAALEEFGTTPASFGDSCIAAFARLRGLPVATFDSDFEKIPGVTQLNPMELLSGGNV